MIRKNATFTYLIVVVLLLSNYYSVQVAAASTDKATNTDNLLNSIPKFDKKIAIVYSDLDPQVEEMANGIYQFISPFYQPVTLHKIESFNDLWMLGQNYWIVIHVYDTGIDGPIISGKPYKWADLADYINGNADKHHILATANTKQATSGLGGAVQYTSLVDDSTEMTDAKLAVINSVWLAGNYIAENAPNQSYLDSADRIRALVVKYFSENINELVERSYQPLNPVGQIDEKAQKERFDKLLENSTQTASYVTPKGVSVPLYEAVTKSLIDNNQYSLVLNNIQNDLTIAKIPAKTGIEGPAGKILDTLLGILLKYVQFVELSPEAVNQINEIMKYIPKVLGIINDPSVENILGLALDIIVQRFPGFKEYRRYVEIALEGFYALRDGAAETVAFALKLIKEFFPANSSVVVIAETVLTNELVKLINKISSGENVFQAILSWIANLVLDNFLDNIFESWLGFDIKQVFSNPSLMSTLASSATGTEDNSFFGRVKNILASFFKTIMSWFVSQNTNEYSDELLRQLLVTELIPNLYPLIGRTIVIDPGHGGIFNNAKYTYTNGTVLYEKNLTLSVGLKFKDALENLGATVYMTRETDINLNSTLSEDLKTRGRIANDPNGDGVIDQVDAFVSIHFNGWTTESAHGHETYYHADNVYGADLSREIYNSVIGDLNMTGRGVKTANYAVLRYTPNIPHSLVELGFITNNSDRSKFETSVNQTTAALAMAKGVVNYFSQGNGPVPNVPKVVMVHGWNGSPDSFNVMIPILESQGIEVVDFDDTTPGTQALTLDPSLNGGNLNTAQLAAQLQDLINAKVPTNEKINIVAHSYGGIVSRYLIEAGQVDPTIDDIWASRVDKLFMHGTPNHGTWLAYPGAWFSFYSGDWARAAEDIKPNSPLLNALGYDEPVGEDYIIFGGSSDMVVSTESPFLNGAKNFIVDGGHDELLTLPSVIDTLFNELGFKRMGLGRSLPVVGDQVTVQLEFFDVVSDYGTGTYFFDVYVDDDGLNNDFQLLTTFNHTQSGAYTWNPGENGPTSPSFALPGNYSFFDIKVVTRVDNNVINTFYFRNITYSEDIDGMDYYIDVAVDNLANLNNTMRISVSGFTNNPNINNMNVNSLARTNVLTMKPLSTINYIQKYIDGMLPFVDIGKLVFWIGGKLGGIKDAKSFLEQFPISDVMNSLLTSIYKAIGYENTGNHGKINEYIELVKGVLNGTVNELSIATSIINGIVDKFQDLDIATKEYLSDLFKFLVSKIADPSSPLRSLQTLNLDQLLLKSLDLFFNDVSTKVKDTLQSILSFILPGALTILSVIKDSPALARIVATSSALTDQQALEEAKTKSMGYLRDFTAKIFNIIPDNFLSVAQREKISIIIDEIPNFLLTLVSSSVDTEASISGILRSLGLFTINIVVEKIQNTLKANGIDSFEVIYFVRLAETMFKGLVDDKFKTNLPSLEQVLTDLRPYIANQLQSILPTEAYNSIKFFLDVLPGAIQFFQDGVGWLINELKRWIASILSDLIDNLLEKLNNIFNNFSFFSIGGTLPIGMGPFMLFEFSYNFEINANLDFDRIGLRDYIISLLFDGNNAIGNSNLGSVIKKVLSFLNIAPIISGNFGIKQLATSEGGIFETLLDLLGFDISFSGYAYFSLMLFKLGANGFDSKSFFKVIAWGLEISFRLTRDITILDLFTGGLGGGFINRLARYIGLDLLVLRITFGFDLIILMRADTPTTSASGIMILRFIIEAGVRLSIGVDLFIAGAKLTFYAGIRLLLTFDQDFLRKDQPLRIIFRILIILEAKVKVKFLFYSKTWRWGTTLEPFGPFDLSPKKRKDVVSNGGMGYDTDNDGIPDDYERRFPGLNMGGLDQTTNLAMKSQTIDGQTLQRSSSDTDGDGLSDKQEIKYLFTDPTIADTDGDGLIDSLEVNLNSNPLKKDSDYDGLSDYEEVKVYGTDPLNSDTDKDGLTDSFEISHSWNMTGITPSVNSVVIGGKVYYNHTDPLNPDTDNDLLLDGQEGKSGPYYGGDATESELLANSADRVWNQGYTHPLDNDTDDDSYMQAYTGQILPSRIYLGDLRDGVEVAGITATIVENGDYITRVFYTDPTRADTDRDTGPGGPGVIMVSDGYELYYTFNNQLPTDPLSGDADNDGLLDVFEYGNNTSTLDPDTDRDGLNDRLEVLLGSNPLALDTDKDGLSDQEEYNVYGTNLLISDSDFDGLSDGDEVHLYKSSPLLQDSDSDGFYDGEEVEIGLSPTSTDADGDGISDRNELFIYNTDPNSNDTDGDKLSDYDEIFVHRTSPLDKDTDRDSILRPDKSVLYNLDDYVEVNSNTNPNNPDSDGDGLTDGEESYLASGQASVHMDLNPLSEDTDEDLLNDGDELQIELKTEGNDVLVELYQPYNSSAVLYDTDFDNVDDRTEILNGTMADNPDTDNDQLSDYDEYYTYQDVSPTNPDSDNDGIVDSLELLKVSDTEFVHHPDVDFNAIRASELMIVNIDPSIIPAGYVIKNITIQYYETYSWDVDTDDDLLPDGIELIIYQPNYPSYTPEVGGSDTNNNGILDGLDLDTDNDGLEDGYEYYGEFPTTEINEWAVFDPDVDKDTLSDGDEVYVYHTRPNTTDTDNDGYSDGFEVIVHSDPLVFTSESDMQKILDGLRGPVMIVSPLGNTEYTDSTGDIPVIVFNVTNVESSWYRYREMDGSFGSNTQLSYASGSNPGLWYDTSNTFEDKVYILEASVRTTKGETFTDIIVFSVNATIPNSLLNTFGALQLLLLSSIGLVVIGVPIVSRKFVFKGGK